MKTFSIIIVGLVAFGVVGIGCGDDDGDPPPATEGTDATEATDTTNPTDGTDATHATDATDAPGCIKDGSPSWQVLSICRQKGELLSVWGTSRQNVWTVGAGGQALHFDGCEWKELDTGTDKDLWWVFGFPGGPVFMVGEGGTSLRYTEAGGFEKLDTGVTVTLFGIWGSSPEDLWSIGFVPAGSTPAAILHWDGKAWSPAQGLPSGIMGKGQFFKVWGSAADDVWVVGSGDLILHYDGTTWTEQPAGDGTDWITITGRVKPNGSTDIFVVGGASGGAIGQKVSTGWKQVAPEFIQQLQGACVQPDGTAMATGLGATLLFRSPSLQWAEALDAPFDLFNPFEPPVPGCEQPTPDYHACFADGQGGFFVVGGNFFGPITEGAILYYGPAIPTKGL